MLRFVLENAKDTKLLAQTLAGRLGAGDLLILSGELGAGKTVFTRSLIGELGVNQIVTSPTFVLIKSYLGKIPIDHIDIYRIDEPEDLEILCIDDLLEEGHLVVIEWGEKALGLVGSSYIQVTFERLDSEVCVEDEVAGESKRFVTLEIVGSRFGERRSLIEADVGRIWSVA